MKKVVKSFLLILPIMFCMVLGLAVPAVSSAADFRDSYYICDSVFCPSFNSSSNGINSYSSISTLSASSPSNYIYLCGSGYDGNYIYSNSLLFSFSSPSISVTSSGYRVDGSFSLKYRFRKCDSNDFSIISSYGVYSQSFSNHYLIVSGSQVDIYTNSDSLVLHTNLDIFAFESDISDFSDSLNVSVEFQPDLSGSVDRTITDGSGASGLSQQLKMIVTNNSRCAIQYDMQIVKTEQNNLRDWTSLGSYSSAQEFNEAVFDDDPIFIYYDNDWVYAHSLDDSGSYFNGIPTKQQKSTQYHYLAAGASDDVTFNYSQINLQEGCSYTVTVRAVKCDYDCASELLINAIEDVYPEMKQISLGDLEVVYSSSFSMLQYKDVKYDPSDSSNGVVPYDGSKGLSFKERYANSYNAVQNSSGQVDYKSKNLYDDPNSFWNKTYDPSSYSTLYPNYRTGFSNTPSSVNNLSASISNFGSFLQSIFSYFPSGVFAIFNLALVMVVIIAIIKVVR